MTLCYNVLTKGFLKIKRPILISATYEVIMTNSLRERRKALGLTLCEVADALGTSKQTIQRYEMGIISNIPKEKIEALAKVLKSTPSALMGWSDEAGNVVKEEYVGKRLPVLGRIACGAPILASEEYDEYVTVDDGVDASFCLRARGDSMIGARIHDGDIVFIREQREVNNGEIAAVIIGDEATLKRVYYYPKEERIILTPENPRYSPMSFSGSELNDVRIIGKATAFRSYIK